MKISEFVARGLNGVKNDMGETRNSSESSIVFPNGFVASIIDKQKAKYIEQGKRYSVAVCDYNGYFDWDILVQFGANDGTGARHGCFETDSEDGVCKILTVIEALTNNSNKNNDLLEKN